MKLNSVNLLLILFILIGLFALFLQNVKLGNSMSFESRRIDELEKRPIGLSSQDAFPIAGESGKIDPSALVKLPVPGATITPNPTSTPLGVKSTSTPSPSPIAASGKKVTYLPIFGGSAQTTTTGWVDVPGSDFEFSVGEYGSASYITWDAIAWVIGGSGAVQIRIFDVTHSVVVPGSEITGSASKAERITSGKLIFLYGNNAYKIQISSQTSSTVQFDFGRIKVVY